MSKSLPQGTSAQLAELVALTRALELSQGQRVNIYTDSKYAYLTLHAHAAIWKERPFKTATGEPIKHFREIKRLLTAIISDQIRSVTQLCPTLCNPMNRSTPGLPVHHQLPEITQTHVHRVSDAIQPSHPLSSPSPPAPNPSQHQSLFQ